MSTGKVIQVIGPVVDVEFPPGQLPNIYNALKVTQEENKAAGKPAVRITLEVASHLGENRVRGIAMSTTDGLTRGMDVTDTGAPIAVPVGRETLGRLINVLGEPVDEKGPIKTNKTYPIHRPAPRLEDQDTKTEVLETGIKVVDLLEPYSKGGKVGLFLVGLLRQTLCTEPAIGLGCAPKIGTGLEAAEIPRLKRLRVSTQGGGTVDHLLQLSDIARKRVPHQQIPASL